MKQFGISRKRIASWSVFFLLSCAFFIQCTSEPVSTLKPTPTPVENELQNYTHSQITNQLNIPWQMDFTPDGRILITERRGVVRVVENGVLQPEFWIDLRDSLNSPNNSGLLGIAVDPNFSENNYVYLGYSYRVDGQNFDYNILVRFKENEEGFGEFDKVLLDEVTGASMHNTGQLKFGPDRKLYWSAGDRHEPASAQNKEDPAGSILRLNPDGTIPDDNPFPGSAVYAYGLRNSQGFAWHPETGLMLATEHGPSGGKGRNCCYDEVNIIEPGKNYGWPDAVGDEVKADMELPLIHSGTGEDIEKYTWAPSGAAFMHTGPWEGTFLFAGLRSQRVWQLVLNEENHVMELNHFLKNEYGRIRSVAQDSHGAIYLLTSNLDNLAPASLRGMGDSLIKIEPHE